MVCMGNICRSPTAHGVMQHLINEAGLQQQMQVDSCGTHGYHVGEPPDARSQRHAARRGYDLSLQRARPLQAADFAGFDLILVMDSANEQAVRARCPADAQHKIYRLTAFCQRCQAHEVPDPYYGGYAGFEHVLDLAEDACASLLQVVRTALPSI